MSKRVDFIVPPLVEGRPSDYEWDNEEPKKPIKPRTAVLIQPFAGVLRKVVANKD